MKMIVILMGLVIPLQGMSEQTQSTDIEHEYQEAVQAYRDQSKSGVNRQLLPFAKEVYLLGQIYHKKEGLNYAAIAQNYAIVMNNPFPKRESIPLLVEAIEIYEDENKLPTTSLVHAYLELAKVYKSDQKKKRKAMSKLKTAIKMAEASNDELLLAETLLTAGMVHLNARALTKKEVKQGIRNLKSSREIYRRNSSAQLGLTDFWLGKAYYYLKKMNKSTEFFENVISQNDRDHNIHQLAMSSHAFLVDAYSILGKPDSATEHCQAIGKANPWQEDGEIKPIYIKNPKYPRSAARLGSEGWVKTVFTVDSQGFAKDIKVVEQSGHSEFSKVSLVAIKDWRFAPKFVDGKPVAAKAVYTLQFQLTK